MDRFLKTTKEFTLVSLISVLLVYGCSSTSKSGKNNAQTLKAKNPYYEVLGERYYVLKTSKGYEQEGVASWYGKKFHGKLTSNGETYDMYDMTAAHKTLPLPSTVRVTNLRNGKSVVVRVNDRGPFVDNRLIDMSYAAAQKLDMVQSGTTLVRVEALDGVRRQNTPQAATNSYGTVYVQLGAFGERANAERLRDRVTAGGVTGARIFEEYGLYKVRIGPVDGVDEYDALVRRLDAMAIGNTHLVVENP